MDGMLIYRGGNIVYTFNEQDIYQDEELTKKLVY